MRSPRLVSPARKVAFAVSLLSLSGAVALSASVPAPQSQVNPEAQKKAREQAIQSAIALVHDEAGFSDKLPIGTFSDATPDARAEIARAARYVPEVVAAALKQLDPAAPPAADRANDAAEKRLATFAGEHSFRRTLAWYEPLLVELAADMPEPKLTSEQLKTQRTQLREWRAKSATYREWARKKGGDLRLSVPPKPDEAPRFAPGHGPFADVPVAHPAYAAIQFIASAGVFTGYPDNTFSGKRALSRYEFSVALQRMLQHVQRQLTVRKTSNNSDISLRLINPAPYPPVCAYSLRLMSSPPGPTPTPFDPAKLPELMAWIRALTEEFDTELAMLGSDVQQLKKNLEILDQRIERLPQPPATVKPQGAATGNTL